MDFSTTIDLYQQIDKLQVTLQIIDFPVTI